MAHIKCFVHTLSVAFILRKKSEWLLSYSWYRINIAITINKTGAIESERERLRYDSCTGCVSCTKKTMKDIMFILHIYIYTVYGSGDTLRAHFANAKNVNLVMAGSSN